MPEKPLSIGPWIMLGSVAVLIIIVFAITSPERINERRIESRAIDEVTKRLKSPGTAEFGDVSTSRVGNRWTVSGWVDSQNAFGALLRSPWRVTILIERKTLLVRKIEIDGEVVFEL